MALPRETILQAIRTRLLDIAVTDGFNYDVTAVELGYKPPQSLNRSDFPLILTRIFHQKDQKRPPCLA